MTVSTYGGGFRPPGEALAFTAAASPEIYSPVACHRRLLASIFRDGPPMNTRVSAATDGITRVFTWEEGAHIEVRNLGGEIVIEANAAGLKTLASHLLALAQDGTPDGTDLHLEENNGLEQGSVGLVLEKCEDE
ncbi:hypothetical protein ABZV24_37200 [Streptomyces sp. NPDC005251]|uniref:Imm32 family immunity protein n=1 Tax=Streptomyces sp. NPDC005251 TaxID=3157166 RepID=UPI0033B6EB1D